MSLTYRLRLILSAALIALVTAAMAAPAAAQGMYYKEITKDGRIYVFNVAANAERFEQTGEMGIGITKPGVGQNGETRRRRQRARAAAVLLQARHLDGRARAGAAGADDRLARRQDAHHDRQRVSRDLQPRAGALHGRGPAERQPDAGRATGAAGDPRSSFRIRRAKFKLEGWIIKPWLTYETQMNWPGVVDRREHPARSSRTRRSTSTSRKGRGHVPRCTSASSSRRSARRK